MLVFATPMSLKNISAFCPQKREMPPWLRQTTLSGDGWRIATACSHPPILSLAAVAATLLTSCLPCSVDMSVEEALASAAEQLNIAAQDPMDPSAEVAETSDVSTPFPTDPESGKPVSRPQRPQSAPPKPLQPKPVEPAANVPSYMRATTAAKVSRALYQVCPA